MTSRRVRGPAAHRATDRAAACKTLSVCYLPSRAPRRGRGGAMRTSRPTAMPHGGQRETSGGAPPCHTRWWAEMGHEGGRTAMPHEGVGCNGTRGVCTAMPHEGGAGNGAREGGAAGAHGEGATIARDGKPRIAPRYQKRTKQGACFVLERSGVVRLGYFSIFALERRSATYSLSFFPRRSWRRTSST